MSKLEKTKTLIDFFKNVVIIFIVGLFGIVGYTFVHVDILSLNKMIIIAVGLVLDIIVIAVLTKYLLKKINELEDL